MPATTLRELRETLAPGTRWMVTNHYITRQDHECYGTREREVLRTSSATFTLSSDAIPEGNTLYWPKASQLRMDDDGAIHMESHPHHPGPFLTFRRID